MLAVKMAGRAIKRETEVITLLWLVIGLTASRANLAGTPKSRSTEARLNDLIPQVFPNTGGTINGDVTVNGSHMVNGNIGSSGQVGASSGSFGSLGVNAYSGGAQLGVNGNTHGSGTGQFDGGLVTSGNASVSGQVGATSGSFGTIGVNAYSGSAQLGVNGNVHASGSGQFDTELIVSGQRVAPGQGTPGQFPIATSTPWEPQVVTAINAIVTGLQAAGIFV